MRPSLRIILALAAILTAIPRAAAADTISVGVLSFDDLGNGVATFDIASLFGLTITVTGLTADVDGGAALTIPASDFTTVDAFGDVGCTVPGFALTGGCNFAASDLLSVTLTGTLSPTTGFPGLPDGFDIASTFVATLLPLDPTMTRLTAGVDAVTIDATLVPKGVPEPSTAPLLALGIMGLLAGYGADRRARLTKRANSFRG
jgi:hypothetical protein